MPRFAAGSGLLFLEQHVNELRLDRYVMPAANLGSTSPLVPLWIDTEDLVQPRRPGPGLTQEDVRHIGYGYHRGCLPYFVQDGYDRDRTPRPFRAAVLENDVLRATFLLDLGGRLWSLYHKLERRELLHVNPVFQPANLGIRNAWFSGGVEWNFCWIGHTPLTCDPLFAAEARLDDGMPVLRMWEWERVRQMVYQMDCWLSPTAPVLLVRVRLDNRDDRTVPIYWWSNIAVPESPDRRVLAPASQYYRPTQEEMTLREYPVLDGIDYSYTTNSPHGGDRFFRIPPEQYPWVASVDGQGRGFYESSTSSLRGRKLWVFGQGSGGRRWQDFLNTPGHPYVEIQGGLGRTQLECLPLPPHTEWEWLEAYGGFVADPKVVHGKDWPAAWQAADRAIAAQISHEALETELRATRGMARREPTRMLHRGAGWGELETLRRAQAGEPSFATPAVSFGAETLGLEQAPWLALLEKGALPEPEPGQPPASWMIQDEWRELLEHSVQAGRSDHWAGWLHLGVMYLAQQRMDEARAAWEKSVALRPSPWAYRMLAALAAQHNQPRQAAELYALAVALAPGHTRLVLETGKTLIAAGMSAKWLEVVETLDPVARSHGHVRLLEARAALELDQLDRVPRLLADDLVLTNVREGDAGPAELWFSYHEKRIAKAEGVPIDDALKARVRKECPPPPHLEYRLHS